MTNSTLDDNITDLERKMSTASDTEKARLVDRLRALLTQKRANQRDRVDADDDMFDNLPV